MLMQTEKYSNRTAKHFRRGEEYQEINSQESVPTKVSDSLVLR
jgi:hypothetical protein